MHARRIVLHRYIPHIALVFLLLGLLAVASHAQSFSPPVHLTGSGLVPRIAVDANGNIDVVWRGEPSSDIWFTRSTDAGATFSTPTQIAGISGAGPQGPLEIAVDSGGGIHILAAGSDLFYAHSTDGGGTFSGAPITNGQGWSEYQPIMTIGPSGSINILWMSARNPKFSVSRSTDGGTTFSTTTVWNWPDDPTGGSPATSPQLALDANENIYATWSYCNGSPVICNLLFSRSSDQGKTYSTPVILGGGESVALAVDTDGNLDLALAGSGILLRRSTDHGATFSTPTTISQGANLAAPQIAVNSKGDIFVVWFQDFVGPLFSRSTDGGSTFSPAHAPGNLSQGLPLLAVDSGDNVDITASGIASNGHSQIFLIRSTDAGNTFSSGMQISNDGVPSLCPTLSAMAWEKSGNIDVVWEEFGSSPFGVTGIQGCDAIPNDVFFGHGTTSDFTISATPASQSELPGGAAKFALTLTATNGFSDAVNLSCTNLPSGAACAFDSSSITPKTSGSQVTLTVTTPPTLAQGNDKFTVNAASGSITHTQDVQVAVGGITGAISPTLATIAAGSSANFQVAMNSTGGFAGQVTLVCSGAPSGMNCGVVPLQTTLAANGSATSTLTVQVASKPAGSMIPHAPRNFPGPVSRNVQLTSMGIAMLVATLFMIALPKKIFRVLRADGDWARGFAMTALIVFVALGLLSCGGATTTSSTSGGGGTGVTSAGTGGTSGGASGTGGGGGDTGGGTGGTAGGTGGSTSVTTQFMVQVQSGGATVNVGTVSITVP